MRAPAIRVPKNFYLSPGTLIGDFPNLILNKETRSSVVCLETGIIFKIMKENLMQYLKKYPGFYILIRDSYVVY